MSSMCLKLCVQKKGICSQQNFIENKMNQSNENPEKSKGNIKRSR